MFPLSGAYLHTRLQQVSLEKQHEVRPSTLPKQRQSKPNLFIRSSVTGNSPQALTSHASIGCKLPRAEEEISVSMH